MFPKITLELIWWLVTAIIVCAVMYPIWKGVQDYPFWFENVLSIVLLITFTRYIFLLKHTFLAHIEWIKVVLVLLSPMIVFYLVAQVNRFLTQLDEQGVDFITKGVREAQITSMGQYIRSEYLFFAVGTAIAGIAFTYRMIVSIWRKRNLGTV